MKSFQIALTLTSILTLTACGVSKESSTSEVRAVVTASELETAKAIFAKVDYLPSEYIVSGCAERAAYVAMEFVAAGIPATFQYMNGSLKPSADISWFYHVAAALKTPEDAEPWIFDPGFSMEPMTRSAWVKLSTPYGKPKLTLEDILSNSPQVVGGIFVPSDTVNDLGIVPDFASLPRFESSEMYSACVVMHEYFKKTDRTPDEIKEGQAKLLARTTLLGAELAARDKVKVADISHYPTLFKPCHDALKDWIIRL